MSRDPFKYFRLEAREVVEELGKSILQLERGNDPAVTSRLLRLAHTLKGAARVVKHTRIAEHAHALETALTPLRAPGGTLPAGAMAEVLAIADAIGAEVDRLGTGPSEQSVSAAVPAVQALDGAGQSAPATETLPTVRTVRTDIAEMDALVDGIAETSFNLTAVRTTADAIDRARRLAEVIAEQVEPAASNLRSRAQELREILVTASRMLTANVDQVERELEQVRDTAERLRLVPASSLFTALERTARDAAVAVVGAAPKKVVFRGSGGNVRLDADVLSILQGALVQVVRNAVAHGIEVEAERVRAHKPATGSISLEITRRGSRVVFDCKDDGRGIDLAAVLDAAKRRGLLPPDARPSDDELQRLLLQGGLSTSRAITEVAGRGIGLDVVREAGARLNGEVRLHTTAGVGLHVRITVPVSLSSFDALVVETGGVSAAIPLESVRRTLRVAANDVAHSPEGDTIVDDGNVIPFVRLGRALQMSQGQAQAEHAWPAVIIANDNRRAALAVERLVGRSVVVMRSLPALAPAHAAVAGASLDAEGNPRMVLDPELLVALAFRSGAWAVAPESAPVTPILVIDDSLTTRMLEQSILESAGYEVDLAASAEEGLAKAHLRRYGLFLVDVEMPGMDGFGFVETIRNDRELGGTPCILVTSRNAPEDKQRGKDAGARAYVVKSEFDQTSLLDTIRKLMV